VNGLLALIAAGVTVVASRRGRAADDRSIRRWLVGFAIAMALQTAAIRLAYEFPSLRFPLTAFAAGYGLAAWASVLSLVAVDTRGRDLVTRVPLLIFAGVALATGRWQVAAWLAAAGTASYRWRSRFGTAQLFQLGLGALALVTFSFIIPPPGRIETEGLTRSFLAFARATSLAAGLHAGYGAIILFNAFVRDPSLGIRRVGWRLALSHLLVVLVPLALLSGMWVSTTVLGVSQDHAQIAARALGDEAERMERALDAAIADPARSRERLLAIADAHEADWPQLRLWHGVGHELQQVAGDSLPHALALVSWPDSIGRIPTSGLVGFDDSLFLGATARRGTSRVVGLVPVRPLLDSLGPLVGARVEMIGSRGRGGEVVWDERTGALRTVDDVEVDTRDSAEVEQAREIARRFGLPESTFKSRERRGSTRLVVGPDTFATRPRTVLAILTQGYVMVRGVAFDQGHWSRSSFLMSADHPPSRLLAGIFQLSSDNPFSYLPIVLLTFVAFLFLVIAIWDIVMVTNMGRSITSAIEALRVAADKLRAGDLGHRIEVEHRDDLWDVAGAFNLAAEGLSRARDMEKEQDRIENELQVARRIQARLLPAEPPQVNGLEIAGLYEPAREVGGDYFDHIALDDGRVLLVIADVSGKSVPAALIMSAFRTALVSQDLARIEPAVLAERLNALLHSSLDPGKFVTAFLGFLDGRTGGLVYVNAGHNPPVLMRRDGSHEGLEKGGTILGILPSSRFEQGEASLAPGDLVALYTDGVTEGANAAGEQWGDDRLVATLGRADGRPCRQIATEIAAAVRAFEGEQGATDDITLVIARRLG